MFLCNIDAEKLATPLIVGGVTLRNRVFLAPMSGVTDLPFRRRAFGHGAGLVVSEMVASGELAKGRGDTSVRIRRSDDMPHMVQLAGREASAMTEAARIAEGEGADIIDINMGCPAKKVTGGYCGSALMRNLDHAVSLIDAVVGAVAVPVTVKMRLGWDDDSRNAPELAARAEQAGVRMVTVHGRTRCQFYEGKADWAAIAAVKQAVGIPVVANGDCTSLADATAMLAACGADAVMVGRASYGAPWAAGSIAGQAGQQDSVDVEFLPPHPASASLGDPLPVGERSTSSVGANPFSPAGRRWPEGPDEGAYTHTFNADTGLLNNISQYIIEHYADMLDFHGTESGLRQARKHLRWYLDRHAPDADAALRGTVLQSFDPTEVTRAIEAAFAAQPEIREAA